jgi:hypothetical protein
VAVRPIVPSMRISGPGNPHCGRRGVYHPQPRLTALTKVCTRRQRRTNSSQLRACNLLPKMVSHDRPVYQEEHVAQLIMARRRRSPHKGRIHLRRSVDRPFPSPLQSCGGPYICGNNDSELGMSVAGLLLTCRPERNSIASTLQPEALEGI